MLQRIQSVFLFMAATAAGLLFLLPYLEVGTDDYFVQEYIPMSIFTVALMSGSIIDIFLFGNRPFQMRIVRILLIVLIAFVGYEVYQMFMVNFQDIHFERGTLLPAFIGYFLIRARQSINKDEKLVQDQDRLR